MSDFQDILLTLKNILIGKTYSPDREILEDGGEKCYNQLSNTFRFSIYFGMVTKK
jgi:hypothetical protein